MSSPTRLIRTDDLKARIAEALSISEIAERLCDVELQRAGSQHKGLCPLHGEDTPSFYVSDAKNTFHCFGCKAGGDAITLVREVHHLDYAGALKMLASQADIEFSDYLRPMTEDERQREELRQQCESWLMFGTTAFPSRVSQAIAHRYGVGERIGDRTDLSQIRYFKDKSYLFDGVIFPYRTARGDLVGWKTRKPDKKMFLVPHDFPLWEPVVWGLYQALPHVERSLIVVEGEYDAMALAEYGIKNVAAIGGSRWTDEQMAILEDHQIREVLFWLDGDEGGRSAAEGIAKRFYDHPNIQVRIALAPAGADPEDVVRAGITDVPEGRVALEWLLRQEWDRMPRSSLGAKLEYVRWVREEYGAKLTGLEESLVLKTVAGWLDVPEADVLDFARAEQTMLQAPESEKVVLGRCIRDAAYYRTLRKRIVLDDFHVVKHRRLWSVLEQLLADGLDWDLGLIKQRATTQGVSLEYVEMLVEMGDLNIGWHEDQIIDLAIRRGVRQDADRFREIIGDLKTPANQLIGTLTHNVTSKALQRGSAAFRSIADQVDEAMDTLHSRMKNPDEVVGVDLGGQFPNLTRKLQGIQPRRLILVAATSGQGKSTITLQWCAVMSLMHAVPIDFISLEMDYDEILFKIASHATGIDSMKISAGQLTPDEAKKVEQAFGRIRKSPLRIYAPDSFTTNEFLLYARESVMERRTEAFVVDYAQMVGPDSEDVHMRRDQQLGRFAYTSKLKIARGLDTTVIAVAQLKRDAAGKEEPTPEDMGDSYDLSRAADVILMLSKAEDSSLHDLWIGKNRQGPGGVRIPVGYDKPNQTFSETAGADKLPSYRILTA
jgi:DNA primase